jgi:hypothetical protein
VVSVWIDLGDALLSRQRIGLAEKQCATHSSLLFSLRKPGRRRCLQRNGVQELPYLVWCASLISFHSCDCLANKR